MCDLNVTLFVKAGRDGKNLGACVQSQRVLMVAELKVASGLLRKFKTVPVNISRPPESFRHLGLRLRVPALYLGNDSVEPLDVADDIVAALETNCPGGVDLVQQSHEDPQAELAIRDFYSRFCFYIRDVSKDAGHLEAELCRLDHYLNSTGQLFLCGPQLGQLDCEVLPKLHQARVAAMGIKGYEIPARLTALWRYLHAAYAQPAFTRSCPCDLEILLHWLEHVGETPANIRKFLTLHDRAPQYSFSVPVFAKPVLLD